MICHDCVSQSLGRYRKVQANEYFLEEQVALNLQTASLRPSLSISASKFAKILQAPVRSYEHLSVWIGLSEGGWDLSPWLSKFVQPKLRKLASASWSQFCFSKVLGGWNLQSRETSKLTTPPSPRDIVGMSPPAANSAASASSASLCFSCQAPCQASFRPLPLGLKFSHF